MSIDLVIDAKDRDIGGGFAVRRALPSMKRRSVGPFVFFDHMPALDVPPGDGMDVRPHPHVGLATVTYLFEGEIVHRDSVGSHQTIRAGDVNWMIAGGGIAHSERMPADVKARGGRLHGIQSWIALPLEHEDRAPSFHHHPRATIPSRTRDGVAIDVIAGTAFGERSPVEVLSPTLYAHARFDGGASLALDASAVAPEHEQRAVYVVEGAIAIDGQRLEPGHLAVLHPGAEPSLVADAREGARAMILGGAKLDGERHIWWNFVASSKARIEDAKERWKERRFASIPGDDVDFIPLPE